MIIVTQLSTSHGCSTPCKYILVQLKVNYKLFCGFHTFVVNLQMVIVMQSLMEYEEHEKRAWSVDFSRTEPSMLVSGSDDGKVQQPLRNTTVFVVVIRSEL